MLRLLTTIVILLGLALPAEAATKWASPTGSGTTCSSGTPCSLTTLIGQLVAGDVGIAKAGSYSLTIGINHGGTVANPITIRAENYAVNCPDPTNDPDGCTVNTTDRSIWSGDVDFNGGADNWIMEGFQRNGHTYASAESNNYIQNFKFRFNHGSEQYMLWLQYANGSLVEHNYCSQFNSSGVDYCLPMYYADNTTINNLYCTGRYNHCVSLKRGNVNTTINRLVCDGVASECIYAGQNNDDNVQQGSPTTCTNVPRTNPPSPGTIYDHTADGVTIRNVFGRDLNATGTDGGQVNMPMGLRLTNVRNLNAQNLFFAPSDSGNSMGVGTVAGPTGLPEGRCGIEPGNMVIRGAIVVGGNVACYRAAGTGFIPSTLTFENVVCHRPIHSTNGLQQGLELAGGPSGFESTSAPTTTYRNYVHNDCASSFGGSTSTLTQSDGAVNSCGTAPSGAISANPAFAGPESVPIPTSINVSHGRALWDWGGVYQPIIDRFRTTNGALVDQGFGSAAPCTGAACDIGANEFFVVLEPGEVWASCALYDNLGPWTTPSGLTFNDSPDQITRTDGGSWLAAGLNPASGVTYRIQVHGAENATNDGIVRITAATASTLTVVADDGSSDAGLVDATDDNSARVGMRSIQADVGAPFATGKSGLAIDIDCTLKRVVMGVCTDPLTEATCDTAIYFSKSALLQKKQTQAPVTLATGTAASAADTSGTCWRTRAVWNFTESLEELTGIWVSLQQDPDGSTHNCSAVPPSPFWAWQAHD